MVVTAGFLCAGTCAAGEDALLAARRLAEVEARYDAAEAAYKALLEGSQGAEAALQLAGLYERVGEIEAAAEAYTTALARGRFGEQRTRDLEARLERCRRQRVGVTRFPVSVEAATRIREIEALQAARRWPAAFAGMRDVLEKFEGTFLAEPRGQYRGLRAWARTALAALDGEGRAAYVQDARVRWEAALADGTEGAYRRFLALFPGPDATVPAMLAWADTLADRGELERAAGLLARSDVPAAAVQERRARLAPVLDSARPRADAGDVRFAPDPGDVDRVYVAREPYERIRNPRRKWAGAVDVPHYVSSPAGTLVVETFHRGDVERVYSVVTCLERGQRRWSLAGDPLFEALRTTSDPAVSGGTVFVTAASRAEFPEFWLCALAGRDGRLLWRKRVGVGATPISCLGEGALHAGRSGPTLACDKETVYYATQMGSVVAFDRDLGEPLWAVSYARVARLGPRMEAPLALLERRTQAVRIAGDRLVLMPRDLNGILVIERTTGRLLRTIRSLELVELLDAPEGRVAARTLAGEVRVYALDDGQVLETRKSAPPPAAVQPATAAAPMCIATAAPHTGEPSSAESAQGLRHEAYLAGRGIAAAWAASDPPALITATPATPWNHGTLAAYAPERGYVQRWARPFDQATGVWAGMRARPAGSTRAFVACSDDRVVVHVLDAGTGAELASCSAQGVAPVRELLWAGATLVTVGTSTLAAFAVGDGGAPELQPAWRADHSPHAIKGTFVRGEQLLVFTQAAGELPAQVMALDSGSGNARRTHVLLAPIVPDADPWEHDGRERFPVPRLAYAQSALTAEAGAYRAVQDGKNVPLLACPVRLLDVAADHAMFEIADYWGRVGLEDGRVTLVSPQEKVADATNAAEREIFAWLATHAGHGREERLRCAWKEGDLRLAWQPPAGGAVAQIVDRAGGSLALAEIEPERIDMLGARVLVMGVRGVAVLVRRPSGPAAADAWGKAPADLFAPPAAACSEAQGLVLDGDLADWPADGWQELSASRHAWPCTADEIGARPGREPHASFRWAYEEPGCWLAVKVNDAAHGFTGTPLGGSGDAVEALVSGEFEAEAKKDDGARERKETLQLTLVLIDEAPLVVIRRADAPPAVGRSVGLGDAQGAWLARRFGWEPQIVQGIAVAAARERAVTRYELRIDARLAPDPKQPPRPFEVRAFDLRVIDRDEAGRTAVLEWGGAFFDRGAFPCARLTRGGARSGPRSRARRGGAHGLPPRLCGTNHLRHS